jgi:phage protein D
MNRLSLPVNIKSRVTSVIVDQNLGLPDIFSMELEASDNFEQPTKWIDDPSLFAIGQTFEVQLGYSDDLDSLMIGEITGLEPTFTIDHHPRLTVRGHDRRHRLNRGRKTRTFVQQKDSDIAAQIASEAGLTAQTTDTSVTHEYVLQANQTDMEFLQERGRRIQYEVIVQDSTLLFRPASNAESEFLILTMKDDLLEFYPRLSSMLLTSEVAVRGWDVRRKNVIVGQARQGDEVSTMGGRTSGAALVQDAFGASVQFIGHHPVATQAEADQMAKARFNHSTLALVTGEGVCQGRTDMRAGKVIKIDGIGTRLSGQYYVTSAVHRFSVQAGYTTYFTVQRNAV